MTAKLSWKDHWCGDVHCGGEVVHTGPSGLKKIRRVMLTSDNGSAIILDDEETARKFAADRGIEIVESLL